MNFVYIQKTTPNPRQSAIFFFYRYRKQTWQRTARVQYERSIASAARAAVLHGRLEVCAVQYEIDHARLQSRALFGERARSHKFDVVALRDAYTRHCSSLHVR